jgi:hypothetical protein
MTITRKISNGGFHYPDYDGEALDDHLVLVDSTHTVPVYLENGLSEGPNVDMVTAGTISTRKVGVGVHASALMPQQVGIGNPGYTGELSDAGHSHESIDPAVEGQYLYPARIGDSMWRGEALYILMHAPELADGYGFDNGIEDWTQITGICTWQRFTTGQIYGRDSEGGNTIVLNDGDIVACWLISPNLDAPYMGLYEVVDCGSHFVGGFPSYTNAVIKRTTNANTPTGLRDGMTFQVVGTDAEFEDEYFTQTADDPIVVDTTPLVFTHSSTYTPGDPEDEAMLTQAQLVTAGVDSETHVDYATTTAAKAYFPFDYLTLPWTPNADEIPAGMWEAFEQNVSISEYGDGVVTVGWDVNVVIGGVTLGDLVLSLESPPLSIVPAPMLYQALLATSFTDINPSDQLLFRKFIRNTGSGPVTAAFQFGSPWTTRVKTTLTFPVQGVTDHQQLSGLTADVADGDDERHPWSGMATGRAHFPEDTATLVAGVLTFPIGFNRARVVVSGNDEIIGIETTGFLNSGDVELLVLAYGTFKLSLRHNHAVSGTVYALGLPPSPIGYGKLVGADYVVTNQAWLAFRLDNVSHCWRMSRLPVGSSEVGS